MNMKLMMLLFSLLFAATAAAPVYLEDATTGLNAPREKTMMLLEIDDDEDIMDR